jgi:flavin reductase (DIM6/NTAB) family NADH-FMN oxidoreductase RutF
MSAFDPRQLRDAFGAFMTGVTVVTAFDADKRPIGFTANSFTSVSLEPPLLLISLAKTSGNFSNMTSAGGFAVNILSEAQQAISNRFARPSEDRFADLEWCRGPRGAPVIADVAAWFDCSMREVVDAGDHVLLIGCIEAFEDKGLNGLGYARGSYMTPFLENQASESLGSGANVRLSAVLEIGGKVLLEQTDDGSLALPFVIADVSTGGQSHLERLAAAISPAISVGFIYSVYEDGETGMHHIVYRCTAIEEGGIDGTFYEIGNLPVARVTDPATKTLLNRFAAEHAIGDFGVYIGNAQSGDVRRVAGEA